MTRIYDIRILLIQALTEARQLQLRARAIAMRAKNMPGLNDQLKVELIRKLLVIDYVLNFIIMKLEHLMRLGRPMPNDIYLLVKLSGEVSRYSRILPPETEYSASDLETLIGYIYSSSLSERDKAYIESLYKDEIFMQVKSIIRAAEEEASNKLSYLLK
ncbi:MAG: hypothetical protein F7C81_01870 [Desulfurococcales archaeon]|nr:hypothetical protein [Desulfurococcales archaeon]MEB3780429.1 hypothetical protein [Desulfurococcales archaeon]